jgi:hypothetical protein
MIAAEAVDAPLERQEGDERLASCHARMHSESAAGSLEGVTSRSHSSWSPPRGTRRPTAQQESVGPADWSRFGAVIPVLSGSTGAGASVLATALVDVLRGAGRCALLIDAAEPGRSGLAGAVAAEGPWTTAPVEGVWARYSWREDALVAHLEADQTAPDGPTSLAPESWLLEPPPSMEVTVADLGQEWLRSPAADPLAGAGAWLRAGWPESPRPLLVVRATRPSLIAAEAALARLDPWLRTGHAVAPVQLVVMASWKRRGWPSGVTGAAGARVAALLEHALVVPYDRSVELGGVTDEPTSPRLQAALAPLLHQWGLLTAPRPTPTRHR